MCNYNNKSLFSISTNLDQCTPFQKAPEASSLRCSSTHCTATCYEKYEFPEGEKSLSAECINRRWTILNSRLSNLREFPGCQRKNDNLNYNNMILTFYFPQRFAHEDVKTMESVSLLINVAVQTTFKVLHVERERVVNCLWWLKMQDGLAHCESILCFPVFKLNFKDFFRKECTVTCMLGNEFKNSATIMKLQCRNGNWVSVTHGLGVNSQCERKY